MREAKTTDASSNASFSTTTPAVLTGQVVTPTATNQTTGDTSEFSAAKTMVQDPQGIGTGC